MAVNAETKAPATAQMQVDSRGTHKSALYMAIKCVPPRCLRLTAALFASSMAFLPDSWTAGQLHMAGLHVHEYVNVMISVFVVVLLLLPRIC